MLLRTKGKPKKVPLKMCKDAVKWYARHLLGERIYPTINLTIVFNEELIGKDLYGSCEQQDEYRNYTININPNLGKRNTLIVLAHEIVHLKQYAKGELKDCSKVKSVRWKGKLYCEENVNYWDQPWEIEAYGRERGLYLRFIDPRA